MAASLSGTKTCSITIAPHLTGTVLTALMAVAPEDQTVAQHNQITDALDRVTSGHDPTKTISQLLA